MTLVRKELFDTGQTQLSSKLDEDLPVEVSSGTKLQLASDPLRTGHGVRGEAMDGHGEKPVLCLRSHDILCFLIFFKITIYKRLLH